MLLQTYRSNVLQMVPDALKGLHVEHVKGGFNIFRRYRISHLQKKDCPVALRHFWSGHASAHVSERYTKLRDEREYRLDWAERAGSGFDIPGSIGQLGQLRIVPKVA